MECANYAVSCASIVSGEMCEFTASSLHILLMTSKLTFHADIHIYVFPTISIHLTAAKQMMNWRCILFIFNTFIIIIIHDFTSRVRTLENNTNDYSTCLQLYVSAVCTKFAISIWHTTIDHSRGSERQVEYFIPSIFAVWRLSLRQNAFKCSKH